MKLVKATISDGRTQWEEDFEMTDDKDHNQFINDIINKYNEPLEDKHYRSVVSIGEPIDKKQAYDWEWMMRDANKFMGYCIRQNNNGYGNRGVKASFKKIDSSFNKFRTGTFGNFIDFVKEFKGYDYDHLELLQSITKEQYLSFKKTAK